MTGANEQQIQQITQELVNEMLSPAVSQMDQLLNPPQPEQPEQPEMPEPPDPEIIALGQGQQQLAQMTQQLAQGQEQIAQGQQSLADMLQELAALTKRTRRRIPVRDKNGDITEVIDKIDEDAGMPGDKQKDAAEGDKDD